MTYVHNSRVLSYDCAVYIRTCQSVLPDTHAQTHTHTHTATRLIRPPRSLYPRRQGRRPGSLFPQRATWDQRKVNDAPRSNNDTHTPYPTCGVAARKRIGSPSLERIIPECFLQLGIIPGSSLEQCQSTDWTVTLVQWDFVLGRTRNIMQASVVPRTLVFSNRHETSVLAFVVPGTVCSKDSSIIGWTRTMHVGET